MISLKNFEISVPLPQPFLPTNSFASELQSRCRRRGKKVCFIREDGTSVSYNDTAEHAESVALFLEHEGVQPEDMVCLMINDKPLFASILLGCLLHSTTVVLACNPKHAASIVKTSSPTALIYDSAFSRVLSDFPVEDFPSTRFIPVENLDNFETSRTYTPPNYRGSVVTLSLVVFSGGSNGPQRGVVLPDKWLHYWMFLQDLGSCHHSALFENNEDVVLLAEPLWRFPGTIILLSALSSGCTIAVQNYFDPGITFHLIERHKINCLPLTAASIVKLASHESMTRHDLSSVQYMVNLGGAVPSKASQILAENLCCLGHIRQFYSLTECAIASRRRGQCSVSNMGKPLPGNRVKIVKDGRKCSLKVQGEIYVVSECMFSGYLNGKKLACVSDKEGWFGTGDVGFFDEKGQF